MTSTYDQQAADFLASHGLKLRATLSNSKPAPWTPCGNHYRVTISRDGEKRTRAWYDWQNKASGHPGVLMGRQTRIVFDYWGSKADAEVGREPSAYDILACLASDSSMPETFEDYCSEFGADSDSLSALQSFRRGDRFAKRLRAFFTETELETLRGVQ